MTHFRIYLYKQKSNASRTFSTFLLCNNKSYGSNISLASSFVPSALGQSKGLLWNLPPRHSALRLCTIDEWHGRADDGQWSYGRMSSAGNSYCVHDGE